MPRKPQFTKEDMIKASLQIVRKHGIESLTARNVGKAMGCSSSPVFTLFENMDDLVSAVKKAGEQMFNDYVSDVTDYELAFKEFGIRLIRFAVKERNLFDFLFLHENLINGQRLTKCAECLELVKEESNLTDEQTQLIFQQMWPFTTGIAMICSKTPESYSEEDVSKKLSIQFLSVMSYIRSGMPFSDRVPKKKTF